jgi:putative flippase GtrA
MPIAAKYALFAILATISNIGAQRLLFLLYDGRFAIYIAMVLGTSTGLIIKYILDKRYIFYYKTESIRGDLRKFILYSLMGVVTTLVFWITELVFDFFFAFDEAKYLGAVLGLSLGYTLKYFLDKRFVFR